MTIKYDVTSIIIGITTLILLSYSVVLVYTLIYLRFILKMAEIKWSKTLLSVGAISLGWIGAVVLSIWFAASINIWVFVLASFGLLFGAIYFLAEKLFGIAGMHRMIYSVGLAVILNPAWLTLLEGAK